MHVRATAGRWIFAAPKYRAGKQRCTDNPSWCASLGAQGHLRAAGLGLGPVAAPRIGGPGLHQGEGEAREAHAGPPPACAALSCRELRCSRAMRLVGRHAARRSAAVVPTVAGLPLDACNPSPPAHLVLLQMPVRLAWPEERGGQAVGDPRRRALLLHPAIAAGSSAHFPGGAAPLAGQRGQRPARRLRGAGIVAAAAEHGGQGIR